MTIYEVWICRYAWLRDNSSTTLLASFRESAVNIRSSIASNVSTLLIRLTSACKSREISTKRAQGNLHFRTAKRITLPKEIYNHIFSPAQRTQDNHRAPPRRRDETPCESHAPWFPAKWNPTLPSWPENENRRRASP